MINKAFEIGDEGMYVPEDTSGRTNSPEIVGLIQEHKLILAFLGDDHTKPVGSVCLNTQYDQSNNIGEFGMLSVSKDQAGKGLGNIFVAKCEERAKEAGCLKMRLTNLEPSEYQHPYKLFLH